MTLLSEFHRSTNPTKIWSLGVPPLLGAMDSDPESRQSKECRTNELFDATLSRRVNSTSATLGVALVSKRTVLLGNR